MATQICGSVSEGSSISTNTEKMVGGGGRREKAAAINSFETEWGKMLKICIGCRKCHSGPAQLPRRDYRKDP